MAFHVLLKRCDECGRTNTFRRPNKTLILVRILPKLSCHFCHPEDLASVCAACRYPFAVVPHHGRGMCFTCYMSEQRWKALQNPPAC
jgi:primosomal protein N'